MVCWTPSVDSSEQTAVLGFEQDAAGDGLLLAVGEEGDALDGLGADNLDLLTGRNVGKRRRPRFGQNGRSTKRRGHKCRSKC